MGVNTGRPPAHEPVMKPRTPRSRAAASELYERRVITWAPAVGGLLGQSTVVLVMTGGNIFTASPAQAFGVIAVPAVLGALGYSAARLHGWANHVRATQSRNMKAATS